MMTRVSLECPEAYELAGALHTWADEVHAGELDADQIVGRLTKIAETLEDIRADVRRALGR